MNRFLLGAASAAAIALICTHVNAQVLPPVPPGDGILFGGVVTPIPDTPPFNTGIPTMAMDGAGVTLFDHDTFGKEGGNRGQTTSDYIYAKAGFIYFDSDTETHIPPKPSVGIPVARLQETGQWQDASSFFGLPAGTLLVVSDVPEPATWAMLILGVAIVGFAARRRSDGLAAAA